MVSVEKTTFERGLEERLGVPRVVAAGRASLGLAAALRAWAGSTSAVRVAVPAAICHDVIVAVLESGCVPVFCDVDPSNGLVPLQEWIRVRAEGASVAIVVHLYGNPADTAAVRKVFQGSDCLVIDDAAQAWGGRSPTGLVGTEGDVGLLSFGATKQIEVGGAALLFSNPALGRDVEGILSREESVPLSEREGLSRSFRARLDAARVDLRTNGPAGARSFSGILAGLGPTLKIGFPIGAFSEVLYHFDQYSDLAARRIEKADRWLSAIRESILEPVGMGPRSVPWRFACRLPGIGWDLQHEIGQTMRALGLNVSHWYLPAHWMLGKTPDHLPGVEQLSREVFQFWVDENTPLKVVEREVRVGLEVLTRFSSRL